MNDLDRAVRDAGPYRPEHARNLDGAEQNLLEEIMSVPTAVRRPQLRRWAIAVAAAAAVTGVLSATALIGHGSDDRIAVPAGTARLASLSCCGRTTASSWSSAP